MIVIIGTWIILAMAAYLIMVVHNIQLKVETVSTFNQMKVETVSTISQLKVETVETVHVQLVSLVIIHR